MEQPGRPRALGALRGQLLIEGNESPAAPGRAAPAPRGAPGGPGGPGRR
jgi:hypothetical protein